MSANSIKFTCASKKRKKNLEMFVSLHIRSMWETICVALPHSSYQNLAGRICVQNSLSSPLKYFRNVGLDHPPSPPWKCRFGQILALWVWVGLDPLPKFKFGQILALWGWVGLEYPPSRIFRETNFCIPRGYHLVSSCYYETCPDFTSQFDLQVDTGVTMRKCLSVCPLISLEKHAEAKYFTAALEYFLWSLDTQTVRKSTWWCFSK